MKGFIAIMQSGSMTQLPDLVVPDQQQTIREMVDLVGPMMRAVKALETRWKEKFPDAPFAGVGATPGVGMMPSFGQLEEGLTVSGIETPTDTDAEASLEAPGLNVPLKITMKKIENAWRLEMPNMPAPEMLEQMRPLFNALGGMAAGMARVMEDFAQRIGNNEYASADDARRALDEEMQKSMATVMEDLKKEFEAMGKDMGGEMMKALQEAMAKSVADQPGALPGENAPSSDTLEPAPANNPPPTEPAPAAESPQSDNNRPKSQLEQDMDNAAARSVLGGGI
ncbi:MAG TPA: hypothetical protein VLM89_00015 [Phycisphaerae bacterium]|nr:hypothetical protein [Phycisphaerae bacterium]